MRPAFIKQRQRLDALLTASPLKHDIEIETADLFAPASFLSLRVTSHPIL
jgi:hypothetical protein